jgi:hypothetical protein
VAFACAEAEEPGAGAEHASGGARAGAATGSGGKLATAGTAQSSGGKGGAAGNAAGGRAGAANGGAAQAGSAGTGGAGTGGAGTAGAGTAGTGGGGGSSSAGSPSGGGGSSTLGCSSDASAGATQGGAAGDGNAGSAFFDDFETSLGSGFTTTRGSWAVIDDGSKVYEQSLLDNELQIAIADGTCFTDQIIEAKLKVVDFGGQSNSYAVALLGRVVSAETHYLLALGSDNKLVLRKRVASASTGATAIGAAKALNVVPGTWYDVRLEIVGTSLMGCVGDVCVSGTDSSIASGGVALATVNTIARFDDLRASAP